MSKTAANGCFSRKKRVLTLAASLLCAAAVMMPVSSSQARPVGQNSPLIITNEPLPPDLQSKVYSRPSRAPQISADQIAGPVYFNDSTQTIVGRKVDSLRSELFSLQSKVAGLSQQLVGIETTGQRQAAEYYASVATISTQLQSGTTPGNPRLVQRLATARENLEKLSGNIASLNDVAMQVSQAASMASFLLESARATYSLTGAVEEDHMRLAQLEDAVNGTVVVIERLLNNASDDVNRTTAYLAAERENMRTLSIAINTGDLFGKSLSNRPFSSAQKASFAPSSLSGYGAPGQAGMMPSAPQSDMFAPPAPMPVAPVAPSMSSGNPRPLVKIRFDRPDVDYEQPVYMAVNEALSRYPDAHFELVAVHPGAGNAAAVAIESTRSRRNAERVLRSLSQMGLSMDRVDLSYAPSTDATTSEVHLYIR